MNLDLNEKISGLNTGMTKRLLSIESSISNLRIEFSNLRDSIDKFSKVVNANLPLHNIELKFKDMAKIEKYLKRAFPASTSPASKKRGRPKKIKEIQPKPKTKRFLGFKIKG